MEIRYLNNSDDPMQVSAIYEQSWKCAYKGIIPQSYLDSIPEGKWANVIEPSRYEQPCTDRSREDNRNIMFLQITLGEVQRLR